jgi:hypothetical protein
VDGPFVRNWFINNHRAENARKFVDLAISPVIPLTYMGPLEDAPTIGNRVCEFWLGPTGDTVYHFHEPYESEDPTTVGPPTYLPVRDLDPGLVFLFMRASNPAWHRCIISSVLSQFDHATIYLGNGPAPSVARFQPIPHELLAAHKELKAKRGQMHEVSFAMKIDFGDRFLAKLALGFGALFLAEGFVQSLHAVSLRNFLWCRDGDARDKMAVMGKSFLGSIDAKFKSLFTLPFGHTFALIPVDGRLALFVSFYGENNAVMCVSDEPSLWAKISNGCIYVIVPGYRAAIGPMTLLEFIGARNAVPGAVPQLQELIARAACQPTLPPFDLPRIEHEAALKRRLQKEAYSLWEKRGRPIGDDQVDWYAARCNLGIPEELKL